jgi:hypothetical protein
MKYLNHKNFTKMKYGRCTIFTNKSLSKGSMGELKDIAYSNLTSVSKKRITEVIPKKEYSVISKTSISRHRNNAIRATFGIKRMGSYDRITAEIYNQLKLSEQEYVPNVYCYGYKRNSCGLVTSTTLITQHISDTFNIIEFIDAHPDLISPVINLAFDTIFNHLETPQIHLDLWAGNILVNKELTKSWIIDVEYFKFNPKRTTEEKLGFCLGYFHRHKISQYIPLIEYEKLAKKWLLDKHPEVDQNKTLNFCDHASQRKISRKERFKFF